MKLDIKVPMRDGVLLSADIYLPHPAPDASPAAAYPAVLMRTPYSNNTDVMIEKARRLANAGYACVVQDCRGRWDSDGDYYAFHQEIEDGYDTQQWVAEQDWCNGKIGMTGASYGAAVQWLSAPLANPQVKCLVPRVMCVDYYQGLVHPGGAFQLNVMMTWGMRTNGRTGQSIAYHNWTEAFRALPVMDMARAAGRDLPYWDDWLGHPDHDEFWQRVEVGGGNIGSGGRWSAITAPALIMGGWYDLYSRDVFQELQGMQSEGGSPEARRSRLIVGPWPHRLSMEQKTGDVDFGAHSVIDLDHEELRWFDHWLKGEPTGIMEEPPLRLFIMGINEWRDEAEWPLSRTDWQRWYLRSAGNANTLLGDGTLSVEPPGDEPSDSYRYDPANPVQTLGGGNCCSPEVVPWGPYDQRPVEMRSDVLCYTSAPLSEDLEVTGPITVVLYAATDGLDTDWTAKLVDVSASGYAMNLCDGIIRARYRESFSKPELLQPRQVYEYQIDVGVTGNVFRRGHRIRLEISSSNFPRYDRNLNTGQDNGTSSEVRQARQEIVHTALQRSHVVLPVIPAIPN